jgi:hypothetical protein
MGAASYKLHAACPELNERYKNCQSLYFENLHTKPEFVTPAPTPDNPQPQPQRVYVRDGKPLTNAADAAIAAESLTPSHVNYACRDMWNDYTDCINVSRSKTAGGSR